MRVSEYVISRLAAEGIDTCFLVYGGAISDLVDALPGRMKYVVTQHEQGAVFAAEGWAKTKRLPGLVIVTSGPGGGNIVTGLQNCHYDSTPLIALAGQVATKFRRPKDSALRQLGFQESPLPDIVRCITKYTRTVTEPESIGWTMDQAIHKATWGRPGPVLVELPNDIQRAEVEPESLQRYAYAFGGYPDPSEAVKSFLRDLKRSVRPGILVGGGAYTARAAIQQFAAKHRIPIFRTWNALDVCPDDSPYYAGTVGTYGGPGRNFGIQNTDLLLVLGCRLSGRITGGVPESFARGAMMYVVDVDPGLLDPEFQPRKAQVNVLSTCEEFLNALA